MIIFVLTIIFAIKLIIHALDNTICYRYSTSTDANLNVGDIEASGVVKLCTRDIGTRLFAHALSYTR